MRYSFYLWHQPLITLALNHARGLGVHPAAALLLIALVMFMPIYALSWILYLLVENLGKARVRGDERTYRRNHIVVGDCESPRSSAADRSCCQHSHSNSGLR